MLGENIKKLRKEKDISLYKLAIDLGVTPPTISNWESGKTEPGATNLIKMAEMFKVSPKDLVNKSL